MYYVCYMVFLLRWVGFRDKEFYLVLADRKDWDRYPKGTTGQKKGTGAGMELDETEETVYKAKEL